MKHIKVEKNVRGFTLVELLAVIVVLAIVMLLAVQAVFPQMIKARKNAFAIEANAAIDAAQSYYMTASLAKNLSVDKDGLCIDIKYLIDQNQFDADRSKYSGWVWIKPNTGGNGYLYTVTMTNEQYFVSDKGTKQETGKTYNINITEEDVAEGKDIGNEPDGCKQS